MNNQPGNGIIDPFNRSASTLHKRSERSFEFHFLPAGFIGKIITRIIHLPNIIIDEIWRNGIAFHINQGMKALISLNFSKKGSYSHMKNESRLTVIIVDNELNFKGSGNSVLRKAKRKILGRSSSFSKLHILKESKESKNMKENYVEENPNSHIPQVQDEDKYSELSYEERKNIRESFQPSIFSAIDATINNFFSEEAKKKIHCEIFCNFCVQENKPRVCTFSYESCVNDFLEGKLEMVCMNMHTCSVLELAPDITFGTTHFIKDLEIENVLGKGGFGSVCKGKMGKNNVAVKELFVGTNFTFYGNFKFYILIFISFINFFKDFKSFQHEVYIQSKMNHPNLVKLYGITIEK